MTKIKILVWVYLCIKKQVLEKFFFFFKYFWFSKNEPPAFLTDFLETGSFEGIFNTIASSGIPQKVIYPSNDQAQYCLILEII